MRETTKAYVRMRCSRTAENAVAVFHRNGRTWALTSVQMMHGEDAVPPGEIGMAGNFESSPAYSGCPECGALSFVRCGPCGDLGCWDGVTSRYHCPWCGDRAKIDGTFTELRASDG